MWKNYKHYRWIIKINIFRDLEIILGLCYINQAKNIEVILNNISEAIDLVNEKYNSPKIIIGGDFNARVAKKSLLDFLINGNYVNLERIRISKDKILNKRGKSLIDFSENNDLTLINGRAKSDFPATYTFISTVGNSVINLQGNLPRCPSPILMML